MDRIENRSFGRFRFGARMPVLASHGHKAIARLGSCVISLVLARGKAVAKP